MLRTIPCLLMVGAVVMPALAVLPGQDGQYKGKALVKYTDLGATKFRTWKTQALLTIEPDGAATFTGNDVNSQLQVEAGLYHGAGYFLDSQRVGNMPLHFKGKGKLKGTFHYAYPSSSEMMEGKFTLRKQTP